LFSAVRPHSIGKESHFACRTGKGIATAPSEAFKQNISSSFSLDDARDLAHDLLLKKAINRGANPNHLETEVLEESQFNMIRGFQTIGKNIRVQMQLKPGLIREECEGSSDEIR